MKNLTTLAQHRNDIEWLETKYRETRQLLQEANPDADPGNISRAANAFCRRYYSIKHSELSPAYILSVLSEKDFHRIRNAGVKCQEIYRTAKNALLEKMDIAGEVKLRILVESFAKMCPSIQSPDFLVLDMFERGITDIERFEVLGARWLENAANFDDKSAHALLGDVYRRVVHIQHPDVGDPFSVILYYPLGEHDNEPETFVGMTSDSVNALTQLLRYAGYSSAVSGRLYDFPIITIQTRRSEENE